MVVLSICIFRPVSAHFIPDFSVDFVLLVHLLSLDYPPPPPEHGRHSHVIGTDTQPGTRARRSLRTGNTDKSPHNLIMQTFSELFCNICLPVHLSICSIHATVSFEAQFKVPITLSRQVPNRNLNRGRH